MRKFINKSDAEVEIIYSWFIMFLRGHCHYFKGAEWDIVKGYLRSPRQNPRKYCAKGIKNDIINYLKQLENIKRNKKRRDLNIKA